MSRRSHVLEKKRISANDANTKLQGTESLLLSIVNEGQQKYNDMKA